MGVSVRYFLILIACLCFQIQGHSVDLFGNEELKEGEISLTEQKQLYQQFFGAEDKKATSSSKRLDLAVSLREHYVDPKFQALGRYMLKRISELCEGSKKAEAYELRVFVFNEEHKGKDATHASNSEHIALLEDHLGKAPKDERENIAKEIAALL